MQAYECVQQCGKTELDPPDLGGHARKHSFFQTDDAPAYIYFRRYFVQVYQVVQGEASKRSALQTSFQHKK